jgi:hypothetical protein
MLKLSFSLSCIAAALTLAACSTYKATPEPTAVIVTPPATVAAAPGTVVSATAPALRPGVGRIESVSAVPQFGSASEGSTRASATRRIGVRMDDGTVQFLDSDAPALDVGNRIEITPDGFIRRPAQ